MADMLNPSQIEETSPSELQSALNQLQIILRNISTSDPSDYINLVSYISTIKFLPTLPQRLAITLISSLILFLNFTSTHTTAQTADLHQSILIKIHSLFQRFTLKPLSSSASKLRLRKSLESLYSFHQSLLSDFPQNIDKSVQDLFNSLRKVSILSETVPLQWTLNAFKNLVAGSCILSTFPTYTSITFPYLPEEKFNKGTVVVDLDNTLVYACQQNIRIRPGAQSFIKEMTELFEVVLFTASLKAYADYVMRQVDLDDKVKLRLYREHLSFDESGSFKNLEMLGRDLERVVIVDDLEKNFRYHKGNGILIRSWTGDDEDRELERVAGVVKSFFINLVP